MINRLRLAAAAVAITSSVVAPIFGGVDEKALLTAAVEATGTTIVEKVCGGGYGRYELHTKGREVLLDRLTMCTDAIGTDKALYMETLRHEAVHVAQACNGWDSATGRSETWLKTQMGKDYNIDVLLDGYDEAHHYNELEAYYLESKTTAEIIGVVEDACR